MYDLSKVGSSLQVFPNKSLYDVRFQPTGMQFLKSCAFLTRNLHATCPAHLLLLIILTAYSEE